MLRKLSLAVCIAGLLSTSVALADNATGSIKVTFSGTVLPTTCTFSINGVSDETQSVELGSIRAQANAYTTVKKLQFSLTDCGVSGSLTATPVNATASENLVIPSNAAEVGTAVIAFYNNHACSAEHKWIIANHAITIDEPNSGSNLSTWDGFVRLEAGTTPKPGTISEVVDFVVTYQ